MERPRHWQLSKPPRRFQSWPPWAIPSRRGSENLTGLTIIASQSGDAVGFLVMATATGAAIVLAWAFLPETKPAEYLD